MMSVMMMTIMKKNVVVVGAVVAIKWSPSFRLQEGVEEGLAQLLRAWPSGRDVPISIPINDLKSFFRPPSFPCSWSSFVMELWWREWRKMSTPSASGSLVRWLFRAADSLPWPLTKHGAKIHFYLSYSALRRFSYKHTKIQVISVLVDARDLNLRCFPWLLQGQQNGKVVPREPTPGGVTWTGDGFTEVKDNTALEYAVTNVPYTGEYNILVRYEPKVGTSWVISWVCNTITWWFDRSIRFDSKQRLFALSTVNFNCNQGHK